MMREKLIGLRERRAQLIASADTQRAEVFALVERADQVAPQAGGCKRMGHAGSRARVQLAVENLCHQVIRHREKILVGGAAPSWNGAAHGAV